MQINLKKKKKTFPTNRKLSQVESSSVVNAWTVILTKGDKAERVKAINVLETTYK